MATGSCQETQALLAALADGVAGASERAVAEAHVASCPACTAEGARLQDNAAFLAETLSPFRMPAELTPEFLLALPRKDPKRRAPAPAAAAASKTLVLGDTRPRGTSPWKVIGGIGFLGAAAGLGWLFLSEEKPAPRRDGPAPIPGIAERDPQGKGPADPKKIEKVPKPAPTGGTPKGPAFPSNEPIRTAADLLAALRAGKGANPTNLVRKGWDLFAGNPAEAKAVRDLAAAEKDPLIRAALVAAIGADASEDGRSALRGYLGDEAAEVRAAAILALGRSLSYEVPRKQMSTGKPLDISIDVGVLPDDPARADLAARLSVEPDAGVRRVLVAALAQTVPVDPAIRARILEGVKGDFGEELQEPCVRALQGVKDPALVEAFGEALAHPGTPKALHAALLEGMVAADEKAAGDKLPGILAGAAAPELRREILGAFAKLGGPPAQKAFTDVLAGDADGAVRVFAATNLQRYPSKEVLDALQKAAENDGDQAVRQEAERVAKVMKPAVEKAEGGGDNPPVENPPAPNPEGN